jgi:hypothetical protein
MKRTLLFLLIATSLFTPTAYGQKSKNQHPKTTFGIQGGANMNNVIGKGVAYGDKLDNDFFVGFHLGFDVEIPLFKSLYFQPGIQAITKGSKSKRPTFTEIDNIYYIEMPLNFVFKPEAGGGHFIIGLGANVAYGIGGKWKSDAVGGSQNDHDGKIKFKKSWNPSSPNPDNDKYVKPLDISAGLTLGYQLKNNLFFQLNGQYGLINITPEVEGLQSGYVQGNAKNISFGLSLGFRF